MKSVFTLLSDDGRSNYITPTARQAIRHFIESGRPSVFNSARLKFEFFQATGSDIETMRSRYDATAENGRKCRFEFEIKSSKRAHKILDKIIESGRDIFKMRVSGPDGRAIYYFAIN